MLKIITQEDNNSSDIFFPEARNLLPPLNVIAVKRKIPYGGPNV